MDIIKNKFEVITLKWIANYIDELYEPYKVYNKPELLKKNAKQYNIPIGNYDDKLEILEIVYNSNDSYAIYKPKNNEIDKIKTFREIEYKWSKLIELRNLQIEFLNKNLKKPQEIEIEKKIDLILEELKIKVKPEKQAVDIFVDKETEKKIINLLIENEFIRRNSKNLEWVGSKTDVKLKLNTLLAYLFIILQRKNYLKNKVTNSEIEAYTDVTLNCKVGAGYFGRLKDKISDVDFDRLDKREKYYDYLGLLKFIKMNTL